MNRREFLAGAGAMTAFAGCRSLGLSGRADFRDALWMWGHSGGSYDRPNGHYNIPPEPKITIPDACDYMGIPNVCIIGGADSVPGTDDKLRRLTRVSTNASTPEKMLALRKRYPNLTAFDLDDLFYNDRPLVTAKTPRGEEKCVQSKQSYEEIVRLRDVLHSWQDPAELRGVLYMHQLQPELRPVLNELDKVLLWNWYGFRIELMERLYADYRRIMPEKPTLLGLYMWDFHAKAPQRLDWMKTQLALADRLWNAGEIEGLIFHCTLLCSKKLAAVEYARDWIAERT